MIRKIMFLSMMAVLSALSIQCGSEDSDATQPTVAPAGVALDETTTPPASDEASNPYKVSP